MWGSCRVAKNPRISWESEVCGQELGGTGGIEVERSGERWGSLFRGEHHYSLDDKGRIVLPQTFRAALGSRSSSRGGSMSASRCTPHKSGRGTRRNCGGYRSAGATSSASCWPVPKTLNWTGRGA